MVRSVTFLGEDVLKIAASISVISVVCGALWAADTLNVKPGQWESTMTTQMTGLPPIPQEVLDKMTPQQRQMMEERMKGNQTTHPVTTKSCLTKEDIQKGFNGGDDDKACTRTVISSSSSKQEIKIECNRDSGKQTGIVKIEAASSESVKGSGQFTMSQGARSMTVNSSFTAKWLGPTCEKEK